MSLISCVTQLENIKFGVIFYTKNGFFLFFCHEANATLMAKIPRQLGKLKKIICESNKNKIVLGFATLGRRRAK